MGKSIGAWAVGNSHEVVFFTRENSNSIQKWEGYSNKLKKVLGPELPLSIELTTSILDLKDSDLIIETVSEDIEVKVNVLSEVLYAFSGSDFTLATCTSSLSIGQIDSALGNPENFIGLHFFNPVNKCPLVELTSLTHSNSGKIVAIENLLTAGGLKVIRTSDRPGFIVNNILFKYLAGAIEIFAEGKEGPLEIDLALKNGCNHPMGPFELLDYIGLDVASSIFHSLDPERNAIPIEVLKTFISRGKLGRKSGEGFLIYQGK
jgi:3-hydroxybutyryl-CoA dehydrogenase